MSIFYSDITSLLFSNLFISLIAFFAVRGRKKSHPSQDKKWHLQFALSKEDAVSQLFLLLSFFFLGVTLLAFNRDFGQPLSWRAIIFITSIVGLISAYYLKTVYTLLFSLVGLMFWWGAQATQWTEGRDIKTSALFAGLSFIALTLYSLGRLHEKQIKFKRFALVYTLLGIAAVTGVLFFFSSTSGIDLIGKMTKGSSFFNSWQITLSLFTFLILLVVVTLYAWAQKMLSIFEVLAVFALTFLFCIIALLPEQTMFVRVGNDYYSSYGSEKLTSVGILWALVFNFAIFFELLGLIFSGYLRREIWLINLGAIFLFLLIIVKYFDWFFSFMDKSIFFIGVGILFFIIGGFMEKSRRYMTSNIKEKTQ